jgi:hypothetical protein
MPTVVALSGPGSKSKGRLLRSHIPSQILSECLIPSIGISAEHTLEMLHLDAARLLRAKRGTNSAPIQKLNRRNKGRTYFVQRRLRRGPSGVHNQPVVGNIQGLHFFGSESLSFGPDARLAHHYYIYDVPFFECREYSIHVGCLFCANAVNDERRQPMFQKNPPQRPANEGQSLPATGM